MSLGMLKVCIFMCVSPAPNGPCRAQGGGGALGGSAMAGREVSVGKLWTSPLSLRAEALVHWEADRNMPGTSRFIGLRLYNKNVAFRGSRVAGHPQPRHHQTATPYLQRQYTSLLIHCAAPWHAKTIANPKISTTQDQNQFVLLLVVDI